MSENHVAVFFYGLFMDEALLATRGIRPLRAEIGYVDGYRLRIGARATLVPDKPGRAYGVLMTIERDQATALYAEESVADYVPEPVSVTSVSGAVDSAICYNLPLNELAGTNALYAESLLSLASRLGFPEDYLEAIRMQGASG